MKREIVTVKIGSQETQIVAPVENEYGEKLTGRDRLEAIIDKAVKKIFDSRCFWWADSGLGLDFGQVMRQLPGSLGNGNTSVTYRVRIDITAADGTRLL